MKLLPFTWIQRWNWGRVYVKSGDEAESLEIARKQRSSSAWEGWLASVLSPPWAPCPRSSAYLPGTPEEDLGSSTGSGFAGDMINGRGIWVQDQERMVWGRTKKSAKSLRPKESCFIGCLGDKTSGCLRGHRRISWGLTPLILQDNKVLFLTVQQRPPSYIH